VKPSGKHLQLLIRVPLQSMRDVEFPKTGPGYLDLSRVDALLDQPREVARTEMIE